MIDAIESLQSYKYAAAVTNVTIIVAKRYAL
jgi:hypothetical protein